ncbi:MAG: carbamoyl-phosphate synthase small subunit, partial [Halobacteriales archaeon]|nr:carbamoyl-phosphate synthase small subunit [Halobacteriales archaeon]
MADAFLALETGAVVKARSRSPGLARGELVFTTSYAGYEESLTDPSYEEQILTFAYPLIGNYGVNLNRLESSRIHPRAIIARQLTDSISEWLSTESIPAIDTLDTRELVMAIRDHGAMRCGISSGKDATPELAIEELENCPSMDDHSDIGSLVSVKKPVTHPGTGPHICLIDCGVKKSIIDSFIKRNVHLTILPYDTTIATVREADPDLLFISNGPGNPEN